MKKKNIALTCLALFGVFSLASCNQKAQDETASIVTADENQEESGFLSSIALDLTNTQQQFFIGDDFNYDGLKVTANYVKYVNGNPTSIKKDITSYYVDSSEINFNTAGTYPITVVYREGKYTRTATYDVKCSVSRLDEAGIEYASGLEINYTGKTTYAVGETFSFDKTKLSCKIHYAKNAKETKADNANLDDIKVDSSNVDTTKAGKYVVYYSYEETVKVNGADYKNVAKAFSVITVA